MIQLNIKPKNIPQGYKKADEVAEILQIGSIDIIEADVKALVNVHLCTAQKQEITEPLNENSDVQVGTGIFKIAGVGKDIHKEQLEYTNPDYASWIKDDDLLAFVCAKLEVELA